MAETRGGFVGTAVSLRRHLNVKDTHTHTHTMLLSVGVCSLIPNTFVFGLLQQIDGTDSSDVTAV